MLGNDLIFLQFCQAPLNVVPKVVFNMEGIALNELHPLQVKLNCSPFEISIVGNDVNEEQFVHVPLKFFPFEVSINGKEVRDLQLLHVWLKSVPLDELILGNNFNEEQPYQALLKF